MASKFTIYQDGAAKTISFNFNLSAYGLELRPMYQPQDTNFSINGGVVSVTLSNITTDNVSKELPIYMYSSSPNPVYSGHLSLQLVGYTSSSDINFSYWSNCVTTHNRQLVIADLACIYNLDKQNGNYNDYCSFIIEVEGILVSIVVNIEHQRL